MTYERLNRVLLPSTLVFAAAALVALAGPPTAPFDSLGDAVRMRLDALVAPANRAERREARALRKVQDLLARDAADLADDIRTARRIESRIARRVRSATGLDPHLDDISRDLRDAVDDDLSFSRFALGSSAGKTVRERVDRLVEKASAAAAAAAAATSRKKSLAQLAKAAGRVRNAERLFVKKDLTPVATALSAPATSVADARIVEGSGIVWTGGAFWTHGDGGTGARLHRSRTIDFQGADEVEIDGAVNVDWEDIAVLGGDLLVCDIGDNLRRRDDVTLYRIRPTVDGADLTATYPFTYPDGAHDAEAVTVIDGRVHLFTKGDPGDTPTSVYRFDTLTDGGANVPVRIGGLDVPALTLVTAADVHPGTNTLTLLAYGGVLVFPPGEVTGSPERIVPASALQSEALCFRGDTLVVTNEQRSVYLVPRFLDRP